MTKNDGKSIPEPINAISKAQGLYIINVFQSKSRTTSTDPFSLACYCSAG